MIIQKIYGFLKTKTFDASGSQINPATSDKQDILLTEIQNKPNRGEIQQSELITLFKNLLQAVVYPPWLDRSANAIRNQVQSGTITTVTTVTTITGMTNLDSYQGKLLIINQNISAWANACRSRIS